MPSTKMTSKWITDLKVKCKTFIQLPKENIREYLGALGFDEFLDTTPKACSMKEKNKLG